MKSLTKVDALRELRAATLVLEHAMVIGLPIPEAADVSPGKGVRFSFKSRDDVEDWSVYLGEHVKVDVHSPLYTRHSVAGEILDQRVQCSCLVFECEA